MVKFRIDHARVISQANVIQKNADVLAAQLKLLKQMELDCGAAWQGPAGETFQGKLAELRSEMTRTQKQLAQLAETITTCADRIQQEDQWAAERAAALKSGRH